MTQPRWLDSQEKAAWNAFLEVSHRVERRVEHHLREQEGLSHPQYEILVRLADAPDWQLRMTELAESLLTSKSGASYQIGKLEKAGLVRRSSCPGDDRGVLAVLTEEGMATLRRAAPGHVELVRSSLIDLLSREQLAALTDGLDTVARGLED
ncbi:DNA-binding transcriptional regulator, MarR family [Actinopolyspora xinjiangensis]|uniref:DNA-binding transcriptional regulator, MarR family n=1 Tax=Actinopolyspora xinjiangensis TaxID=405564 RepID=A0A1H0WZ26_9ACTN|nr:MarR family transcriptional regulator [Actinopolyspora xinjiangensis]SDP95978.1 DNA-binding transcriptional regulator, MarR family [Actinopolyspora xinjiangensis]